MPKAFSTDLRWRILWLRLYKGLKSKTIAELLYVHTSTVNRVVSRYNTSMDVAPITEYRHGPARVLEDPTELLEAVVANPSMYFSELRRHIYQVTGVQVSVSTIYRTLKRLGLTRKKLRHISIRQCDQAREQFMTEMAYLDADMIVWLDETGNDQKSGRRNYGYHLRGMVPTSYHLTMRGKRLSTIAIMSTRGIEDFDTYDESITGDVFGDFIDRCLVPILQPFNGSNEGLL